MMGVCEGDNKEVIGYHVTMIKKINICLICGGQSAEHEISIISTRRVFQECDKDRYDVSVIYISKQGVWYWLEQPSQIIEKDPQQLLVENTMQRLHLTPHAVTGPWVLAAKPEQGITVD